MSKFTRLDRQYNLTDVVTLADEQIDGVEFILDKFNCIIGFQTGLGKTMTTLTGVSHIIDKTKKTVCMICCPKSANSAFIKELTYKLKRPYSIYTTDEKEVRKGSRYMIFNYSNYSQFISFVKAIKQKGYEIIAIFDEIHQLGSENSSLAVEIRKIRALFKMVVGSTGTILANDILGTYRIVNFVRPGFLGTIEDFKQRYIIYKKRVIRLPKGRKRTIFEVEGYRNLDELSKRLEEVVLIRRLQYNLDFIFRSISLTSYEQEMYKKASEGLIDSEDEKVVSARLHDLQRVADGTHPIMDSGKVYSKMKLMLNTIYNLVRKDEGCIIYTEYEDTYKEIGRVIEQHKEKLGYRRLYYITGKTKYADRLEVERDHTKKDIIIITRAGCQSINLQQVNNIIMYDTPFSILWYIQLVGRIARMDSPYDKQKVIILEVEDTIDTYKKLLIQEHSYLIKAVFGKEGNLPDIGSLDKDLMKKYRNYFKQKFLWNKV